MKEYPKIKGSEDLPFGEQCIAFDKLDGSNLRFEYDRKKGWHKFGTRHRLFDRTEQIFGPSIDLFKTKYADSVEKIVLDNFKKPESFIVYAEFFGPNSFAGIHDPTLSELPNDPKDLVMFDVNIHKKGFISPKEFIRLFGSLHIPRVIYEGILTEQFVMDIREGKYPVVEGVILKGGKGHEIWFRKIKTNSYIEKLRRTFGIGWTEYGE